MNDALQQLLDRLTALLAEKPLIGAWYTTVVRFVFPLLALMILVGAIRSLWKVKHPDEVWGSSSGHTTALYITMLLSYVSQILPVNPLIYILRLIPSTDLPHSGITLIYVLRC